MIWWLVILGIFIAIFLAMYVPNWVRWARWNRRRKKLPPGQQKGMRAPVAPPFWSSYGGAYVGGASGLGGGDGGGGGDAGFGAGAGFDGGGGDGGGDGSD